MTRYLDLAEYLWLAQQVTGGAAGEIDDAELAAWLRARVTFASDD